MKIDYKTKMFMLNKTSIFNFYVKNINSKKNHIRNHKQIQLMERKQRPLTTHIFNNVDILGQIVSFTSALRELSILATVSQNGNIPPTSRKTKRKQNSYQNKNSHDNAAQTIIFKPKIKSKYKTITQ